MASNILGFHHITAIAGDLHNNYQFYTGVLGLRMVKQTVNYDDPYTSHLYYGDATGSPGTIITFFSWPGAPKGSTGIGQASTISFSVPEGSLEYWLERFENRSVDYTPPLRRFDEELIVFSDPDGLELELVANGGSSFEPWGDGPVPSEFAVRGIHSVALVESDIESTAAFLQESVGFGFAGKSGERSRFLAVNGKHSSVIDLLESSSQPRGELGAGTIHHVALRVRDDEQQATVRRQLLSQGLRVTQPADRNYFKSIYFRGPGSALFEIATDGPGFTVDEPVEKLGTDLCLPPWLEHMRGDLETRLITLKS